MPRGFAGAKVDGNQREIREALEKLPGVTVQSLAPVGGGTPDLLVGVRGRNLLLEVKREKGPRSRRRWLLDASEAFWHATWSDRKSVV